MIINAHKTSKSVQRLPSQTKTFNDFSWRYAGSRGEMIEVSCPNIGQKSSSWRNNGGFEAPKLVETFIQKEKLLMLMMTTNRHSLLYCTRRCYYLSHEWMVDVVKSQ